MKNICILGATGSIGTQTLDVIKSENEDLHLYAASANTNYIKMINIIEKFKPAYAVMVDEMAYKKLNEYCKANNVDTKILFGLEGLNAICTLPQVDIVVTSVVGSIGLIPTLKAIQHNKDIALANKETLVTAGHLVMEEAARYGVKILPVDSEHGAIYQCLQGNGDNDIFKIKLTASGGPFRGKCYNELINITSKDALKHPKWNMGKKISIDSSTLMNKALEVIEAHWLFKVAFDDIDVIIHPQSIIHSMVEYTDGSVIAQLASTDMKLPIQYALNYPKRKQSVVSRLDFYKLSSLTFEKPDLDTFKCLKLGIEAGKQGGTMPVILNASNEIAVNLFLQDKIRFLDIANIVENCLSKFEYINHPDLNTILDLDENVRKYVYKKYDF